MHIAFNAWFWNRPDTGSGQYLRGLVGGLRQVAPDARLTLVASTEKINHDLSVAPDASEGLQVGAE